MVTLKASSGGREARHWCSLLFRMYTLWAQQLGDVELVEWYADNPTDIREVSFLVPRGWCYLRQESGFHRLTRVSPFGSADKLHTSWISVCVIPEPQPLKEWKLNPKEVEVEAFRSSGPGGQGVNTTDSAVRLTHRPTGIKASCQATRSQLQNKERAWNLLVERICQSQRREPEPKIETDLTRRTYVLNGSKRIQDAILGKTSLCPHRVLEGHLAPLLPVSV